MLSAMSYKIGFGLEQRQRSSMALGMCTRNIAAVFAGYFGITNPPPGLFVMIILVVPLALIVAWVAACLFARTLSVFAAITGVIYQAMIIARLVGLYREAQGQLDSDAMR